MKTAITAMVGAYVSVSLASCATVDRGEAPPSDAAIVETAASSEVPFADEAVLYRYSEGYLDDGEDGVIVKLQRVLNQRLAACGDPLRIKIDGKFGSDSAGAVAVLAQCPEVREALRAGSPAFEGALTVGLWRVLFPGIAPPTLRMRAKALLVAFEGTDYRTAEWNFCQSGPAYDPPEQNDCYSNDNPSFITWGPNGATADHGHELQAVVAEVERQEPQLLDDAFGVEAAALRKLLRLRDEDIAPFCCGVWSDPWRRDAWIAGFQRLGAAPSVQEIYDRVYESSSFDGGKIQAYVVAWERAGLTPTEVDFAFFIDRAAHMSADQDAIDEALRAAADGNGSLLPSEARRALALNVLPKNASQRTPRLGRDVSFYVDAIGESALTAPELAAWNETGRRRASDIGLSDTLAAPPFTPAPPVDWRPDVYAELTAEERSACPDAVLQANRDLR